MDPPTDDREANSVCDQVRKICYAIHQYYGHGHMEKVYKNALAHRLQKTGLTAKQQEPITVYDEDGTIPGACFAGIVVNDWLILELKAVRTLAHEHTAQVLGYLKSARLRHGLLINFGSHRFEIKKYAL